jgi:CheY-like chemotaxis protein
MLQPISNLYSTINSARIAIIEDDDSIQSLIDASVQLTIENTQVLKYSNAKDAIYNLWEKDKEESKSRGPSDIVIDKSVLDLLFIDIFLDDKSSGFDVLEYCQNLTEKLPIVLMSSQFSKEQLEKIEKFNFEPILLQKPFEPQDIVLLTNWLLKIKPRRHYEE